MLREQSQAEKDYEAAIEGVRAIISYMGDDPTRPGLIETPKRVLEAWIDWWGGGYTDDLPDLKVFQHEGHPYDQMVLVSNISFYSHCEHHLAPFYGRIDIAYIPGKAGLVGISKLARVAEHFARRLQVQERLTREIADYLLTLSPDLGVVIRAKHMCMMSRGVMQPNSETVTSTLHGAFRDEPACRAEFLKLVGL